MKRTLALLMCFVMLLSLVACAGEEQDETKTLVTEEVTKEENKHTEETKNEEPGNNDANTPVGKVVDLDAIERLNAIPIANSSMTTDQLRQICVDFFKLQLSFRWTPSKTLKPETGVVDGQNLRVEINKGTVYGGIPYTSVGSGNLYRALDYYDPQTGVIDLSYFENNRNKFVNACSGSAVWAWERVVNTIKAGWTPDMTQYNGYLTVGPYTYSKDIVRFHKANSDAIDKYTAKNVVLENGEQVMYESYAKMLPADGLTHPGHVRMNVAVPHVERNADGTINGEKSYTIYCDQQLYVNPDYQSDGSEIVRQGGVDVKVTFRELFNTYYIPFTFAEFLGTDPVEDGAASLVNGSGEVYSAASTTALDVSTKKIQANYAISDVYLKVIDANGEVKYQRQLMTDDHYLRSVELSTKLMVSAVLKLIEPYAGSKIEISARLSTGATVVAYSGTLVAQ